MRERGAAPQRPSAGYWMATVQVHWPVAPHGSSCPSRHESPAQHDRLPAAHVWPAPVQLFAWQVPCVEPAATLHASPLQQSAFAVHGAAVPWHTTGGRQVPA